jgi:hypothetical protein
MFRSSCTSLVPATPEQVWAVLARFGDLSEWGTGVSQSSLLTEAAEGVGATRRVQIDRNALRETVTQWQPPRELGYRILGLPKVVREAGNTWLLAAEGQGTRVRLTASVTTKGGPLVHWVVAAKIHAANARLLAGLHAHVVGRVAR